MQDREEEDQQQQQQHDGVERRGHHHDAAAAGGNPSSPVVLPEWIQVLTKHRVQASRLEALASAQHWKFKPALLNGQPVAMVVTLIIEFKLPKKTEPASTDDFAKDAYAPGTDGLVAPVTILAPDPHYTSDAMRAKIQGEVELERIAQRLLEAIAQPVAFPRRELALEDILHLDPRRRVLHQPDLTQRRHVQPKQRVK